MMDFDQPVNPGDIQHFSDLRAGIEDLDSKWQIRKSRQRDEQSEDSTGYQLDSGEIKGNHLTVMRTKQI